MQQLKHDPYDIGEIALEGLNLKCSDELLFQNDNFVIKRKGLLIFITETEKADINFKETNISYSQIYRVEFFSHALMHSKSFGHIAISFKNDMESKFICYIYLNIFDLDNFVIPILQLWNIIAPHKMKPHTFDS